MGQPAQMLPSKRSPENRKCEEAGGPGKTSHRILNYILKKQIEREQTWQWNLGGLACFN